MRREGRANKHLIDRRVELDPIKSACKCRCVFREQIGKIWVLKITDPIWNAKMTKVGNRNNIAPFQIAKRQIGKTPVVFLESDKCLVQRNSVTQKLNAHVLHQIKILAPPFVMLAQRHFINAMLPVFNGGRTVLSPRGEPECLLHELKSLKPCKRIRAADEHG